MVLVCVAQHCVNKQLLACIVWPLQIHVGKDLISSARIPLHQKKIPEVVNVGQTIVLPRQGFIASLTSTIARSNVVKERTEPQVMDRVIIVPLESGQVKISFFQMVSVKIVQEELGRMKPDFALKTIVKIVQQDTKVLIVFL